MGSGGFPNHYVESFQNFNENLNHAMSYYYRRVWRMIILEEKFHYGLSRLRMMMMMMMIIIIIPSLLQYGNFLPTTMGRPAPVLLCFTKLR